MPTDNTSLITTESLLPANPSWARAKQLIDAAAKFEQCKLHSQVMLGFELIALHRAVGVANGIRTEAGAGWVDTLERELKIKHTTAYRFMDMARRVADKKLSHITALRGVDLLTVSVNDLNERQSSALENCVRRITDQKTQRDFLEELGMADSEAEARAKGGDNDYRRWVRNTHPELLNDLGNVPTRVQLKREQPAVFKEWELFREAQAEERARHKPTMTQQVALANAKASTAAQALLDVTDDKHAGLCGDEQLAKLEDAARLLLDYIAALRKARRS